MVVKVQGTWMEPLSHAEWRKIAKKCRRSRIRKLRAVEREEVHKKEEEENLKSASYLTWQKEQEALDLFARIEEERIQAEENQKWMERELQAQEEWRQCQEKIALFKAEKAKQELRIREEWEREQKKIKEIEEKNRRERDQRENEEKEFKQRVEDFIAGARSELPAGFRTKIETKPDKEPCPFFAKVGACRFFDNCSRNHIKPSVSRTLLLNNFFTHLSMENQSVKEYDTDMSLEFDEREMHKFFLEFYQDAMPELRSLGAVTQFKVCCNQSPHLRGNVYVRYATERDALRAYYALSGRYYGGKRIRVQFCQIPLWSKALCGLFLRRKCPKGGSCNFLHVFRHPTSEFADADNDRMEIDKRSDHLSVRSSNWGWSSSDSESEGNSTRSERKRRHRRSRGSSERESISTTRSERRKNTSPHQSSRRRSSERQNNTSPRESCRRESRSERKADSSSRNGRKLSNSSERSRQPRDRWSEDPESHYRSKDNSVRKSIDKSRENSTENRMKSKSKDISNYSSKDSVRKSRSKNEEISNENRTRRSGSKDDNKSTSSSESERARHSRSTESESECRDSEERRHSQTSRRSRERDKNWKRRKRSSHDGESIRRNSSSDEEYYKHKKRKKKEEK